MKVGFISLGCAKNRVDTEIMMGVVKKAGHQLVERLEEAETVIINTCGFISEAQEEAIDTILETARLKEQGGLKHLLAVGCLTQRFGQQIYQEIPELDGVLGIASFDALEGVLEEIASGGRVLQTPSLPEILVEKRPRILSTPPGWAYLKIVDGCDNHCRYCTIPSIRGKFRSRSLEELSGEAQKLVRQGIKELILVGQDTACYGRDLYGKGCMPQLLELLAQIPDLEWLRVMYLHPAHIDQEIIEALAGQDKVIPYLETPIQHASSRILQEMGRRHDRQHLEELISSLRARIPGLVLRTTVMLGFPGEQDSDFQELEDFVLGTEFDWLGAFVFQAQEGTPAAAMTGQIPDEIKVQRRDRIMTIQKRITRKKNIARVNTRQQILVSAQLSKNLYLGRGYFQAPEVDGVTLLKSETPLKKGQFFPACLKAVRDYDMIGEIIDESAQ
ncbi:MAG TPA: 30S ribosomal protein S12 methylthiotransferase RimO [Syntrophomonadaceae bacterium]|nr:30S ribosomal protein S12 methylthiotransferase RimO [Syntrophomonadaceae bacterium]